MISLQQALTQVSVDRLGSKYHTYLSYDKEAGWSVVHFGWVREIFRWLGFYASTHLKTVVSQLHKEVYVPSQLIDKIDGCWTRHGGMLPRQTFSLPTLTEPRMNGAERMRLEALPQTDNHVGRVIGGTYFHVEPGNMDLRDVKAVVSFTHPSCLMGGPDHNAMLEQAGDEVLEECRMLPKIGPKIRCQTGEAVITRSGELREQGIERIIHAVGPIYMQGKPEESKEILRRTYRNILNLARENGIRTLALPVISEEGNGYPFPEASYQAINAIRIYLREHTDYFNQIQLIVDSEKFALAREAWRRP